MNYYDDALARGWTPYDTSRTLDSLLRHRRNIQVLNWQEQNRAYKHGSAGIDPTLTHRLGYYRLSENLGASVQVTPHDKTGAWLQLHNLAHLLTEHVYKTIYCDIMCSYPRFERKFKIEDQKDLEKAQKINERVQNQLANYLKNRATDSNLNTKELSRQHKKRKNKDKKNREWERRLADSDGLFYMYPEHDDMMFLAPSDAD